MRTLFRRIAGDLLHLVAPNICSACDEPIPASERRLCDGCRHSFEPAPWPRDIMIDLADRFAKEELSISAIASLHAFREGDRLQRVIHALKYGGCYALGVELGGDLGRALGMFVEFDTIDIVVPVPLHSARRRERGYNQAEAIARGVSGAIGSAPVIPLLSRRRHTGSQTLLDADGRRANVDGAFTLAGKPQSPDHDHTRSHRFGTALICDDVFTTGATLNSCATVLLNAGVERVVAATVARDMPADNADPNDLHWLIPLQLVDSPV